MDLKIDAEYPFDGYKGYIRIVNSGKSKGRRVIGFYSMIKTPKRLTMSYARYLMCVKEKRILSKDEQIDHKDSDKTNDCIENLQILSSQENNKKRVVDLGISLMMVELKCPVCNCLFSRGKNRIFLSKKGYYSTCSKKCKDDMNSIKSKMTNEELKLIGISQIIRQYRISEV